MIVTIKYLCRPGLEFWLGSDVRGGQDDGGGRKVGAEGRLPTVSTAESYTRQIVRTQEGERTVRRGEGERSQRSNKASLS